MDQQTKPNRWFDYERAAEVVETYNRGAGSSLPADDFVGLSVLPPATGAARDFSYIAPDIPLFDAERCVACMECVQNCPDTAILGKVVRPEEKDRALAESAEEGTRSLAAAQFVRTTKFFKVYEKQHAKNPELPAGAEFGIFIDPTKCKGCGECVEVCGEHNALRMVEKTTGALADVRSLWRFYESLPPSPDSYVNPRLPVDLMLKRQNIQYVGGAGSCMGCGEASVLRQALAMTSELVGTDYGIVAATGCNTVYGSTYPYNPFLVPWANSLFENVATFAMGVRRAWNDQGHAGRVLWAVGGDGGMFDIGFQALSRLLASGMNVKVLVLDTQVYSNTGGQTSTASFTGQDSKMSVYGKVVHGKPERRKEVAQICMMHPNTYVAQVAGPITNHFYKAVRGAIEFPGPAVVIAYTTCQPEHGVADDMAAAQARLAVECRAFPLLIHDPRAGDTLAERLSLQGNPSVNKNWHRKVAGGKTVVQDFVAFARTEGRFRKHFDSNGSPSETLLKAQEDRLRNWWQLQELAGVRNAERRGAGQELAPGGAAPPGTQHQPAAG